MSVKKIFCTTETEFNRFFNEFFYPSIPYKPAIKNYDSPRNLNPTLCKICGGHCCQKCGCHFSPDDFNFKKITDENGHRDSDTTIFNLLKKEIQKGYIAIEYVSGEVFYSSTDAIILRARNRDEAIVSSSERSPCILLTENGCKLDYEHRPSGGRLLIPMGHGTEVCCYQNYDIYSCCKEWLPFKSILKKLYDYFKNFDSSFPCSI